MGYLERRETQDLKDTKESSVYQGGKEMLETMDKQVLKVLLVRQAKLAQMEQMDPRGTVRLCRTAGTRWRTGS